MEELSRRSFLKKAGLLAGGATAASFALTGCESPENTSASGEQGNAETPAIASTRPEPGTGQHPTGIDTVGTGAQPIAPVGPPTSWDDEVDIVVVGTGMGGLTATLYIANAGRSVIAIEKSSKTGGASRHAAFNQINAGGSKAQDEMGWAWPVFPFDAKEAAAGFQKHYQYSAEEKLLVRSIAEGGKWADWMCGLDGVRWQCAGYFFADEDMLSGKQNVILANDRTMNALTDNAMAAGANIMTDTELTALVADAGAVVGVQVKSGDSETYIKANEGVILCAGGFGYNLDMMEKYAPSAYMYSVQGGPTAAHTGEAIRMGVGMGADISGYNSIESWCGALDDYWGKDGNGIWCNYLFAPTRDIADNPWLQLDVNGNRLPFYMAQANYDVSPFTGGGFESTMATYMASPDHRLRSVLDADFEKNLTFFKDTLWMGIDRVYPPTFYSYTSDEGRNYLSFQTWEEDWQSSIDRGIVKKADSIEELAPMIGMKPDALAKAIDDWNALCEKGQDDELAIPYEPEWLIPIKTAPYYGIITGAQSSKTLTGLRVNPDMQVISTDHEPIPGLYAGWTTAGGICGENMLNGQWGKCSPFGAVAMSGVGGWMAAKGILGEFVD
jgi:hypothetical protein